MHRRTLNRLALSAPVLAAAATLGFGRDAEAQAGSTITGAFDVGPGGMPGNFNPMTATAGFTWLVLYLEPLVIYDAKLENIEGALASSYETSADQRSYTFHLADARWHDGQPFTSADVRFTIELAKNPASGSNFVARLAAISAVETPDPHTAVIRLGSPNASLLDTLTKVMMLPQHALSAIPVGDLPRHAWWSTTPIGTGPFRFSRYVNGQYVALAANPDFRGGRPKVDAVVNRYFENTAGAVAALRSGEIQFSYVEADDVATFKGQSGFRLIEGSSYVVNYLGFNEQVPIWKDVRVRRAVMCAIDRKTIIASVYGGAAMPANCGYIGTGAAAAWARCLRVRSGAREIAAAGSRLGAHQRQQADHAAHLLQHPARREHHGGDAGDARGCRHQRGSAHRGRADLQQHRLCAGHARLEQLRHGLCRAAGRAGPGQPQCRPEREARSRPRAPTSCACACRDLSAALNAAMGESDAGKRTQRYQDVCRVMNAELPWATLWVTNRYGVASTRLQDFTWVPAPAGGPYQAHPERWALAPLDGPRRMREHAAPAICSAQRAGSSRYRRLC